MIKIIAGTQIRMVEQPLMLSDSKCSRHKSLSIIQKVSYQHTGKTYSCSMSVFPKASEVCAPESALFLTLTVNDTNSINLPKEDEKLNI